MQVNPYIEQLKILNNKLLDIKKHEDEKKDNRFKDLKNYIELNNKAVESKDVVKAVSCLIDISTQHVTASLKKEIVELAINGILNSPHGFLLDIAKNTSNLHILFSDYGSKSLWDCFLKELVYSYDKGLFDYTIHNEMITVASIFDISFTQYSNYISFKSYLLPFLFVLIPRYILTCYYYDFTQGLLTTKQSSAVFYSRIYSKYQLYSNWFLAGIHRLVKHSSNQQDLQLLANCLQSLSPSNPFFQNLTNADLMDLFTFAQKSPENWQLVEKHIQSTSSYIKWLIYQVVNCESTQVQSIIQQCLNHQDNATELLKQILYLMHEMSHFNNLSSILQSLSSFYQSDYSTCLLQFIYQYPIHYSLLSFIQTSSPFSLKVSFICLFYTSSSKDQELLLKQLLTQCLHHEEYCCLLCDYIIKLYFDESIDIFNNDSSILDKRTAVDRLLTLFLQSLYSYPQIKQYSTFIQVLYDLWASRLNLQTVMKTSNSYGLKIAGFANPSILYPLYSYSSLQQLLEINVLLAGEKSLSWYLPILSTTLLYIVSTRLQIKIEQKSMLNEFVKSILRTISQMSPIYSKMINFDSVVDSLSYQMYVTMMNMCYTLVNNIVNKTCCQESYLSALKEVLVEANTNLQENSNVLIILKQIVNL